MATQALMQALGRDLAMDGSPARAHGGVREPEVLPPMRFELLDALRFRPEDSTPLGKSPGRVAAPLARWLTRAKRVPSGSV